MSSYDTDASRQSDSSQEIQGMANPPASRDAAPALFVSKFRMIWRRRGLVARTSAIGLVAAISIALWIPKEYRSSTQLMPPDVQSGGSEMAMLAALTAKTSGSMGALAGDLLGVKSSGALFVGVMRSESVQGDLVKKFDLRKIYGRKMLVDAREALDRNTAISEDRKSGIITITVTDHDPKRSAELANAYVDELNSLVVDLSTSSAHRERVFLQERLTDVKQDLDDAAAQLAQFSSKNGMIDVQQQGKAMFDAASNLAGEMIAVQSQLQGLRQVYTDNNVRVRELSARSEELRKQLDKLSGTKEPPQRSDSAATQNDRSPIEKKFIAEHRAERRGPFGASEPQDSGQQSSQQSGQQSSEDPAGGALTNQAGNLPSLRQLPLLGVRYEDFYRRAKTEETVYELLTEQYELAKVEEAKETPSVKVLDRATWPEKKSYPPRAVIALMGLMVSFCMSIACILTVDHWRQIDPADPRKRGVQEIVAMIKSDVTSNVTSDVNSDVNSPQRLGGEGRQQ